VVRSSEAWDAQACSRVPSTEKCSSLSSGSTSGEAISFSRKRSMISSLRRRSLFLLNVVGCQTPGHLGRSYQRQGSSCPWLMPMRVVCIKSGASRSARAEGLGAIHNP
jgi:hypothetical protein